MGAVTRDIYRTERDYTQFTLSDERVVKYLILYRSKNDILYGANTNITTLDCNQAGELFDFNQELIVLYASLDTYISNIKLNEKEEKILSLLYEGNTITDLINHYGYPQKTAYRIFNKIVNKIVKQNNKLWKVSYEKTIKGERS